MPKLSTVSDYEPPVKTSSKYHMKKATHDMFGRLLKEAQAKGMAADSVREMCRVFHRNLHIGLRRRLTTQRVVDAVRVAVIEANWGHACACCAFDRLLEEAKLEPDVYGCTHDHQDASPDPDAPVTEPAIRRVATAMASPNPVSYAAARQRAAYPYAYGYSSGSGSDSDSSRASPSPSGYASSSSSDASSSSSDSGRVSKTKRTARASPYARPTATPRSRSVEALATRVAAVDLAADSDVDAVTGQLKRVAIADNGGYYYYSQPASYNYCPQPQPQLSAVRTSSWPCTIAEYYQTNRV